VRHYSALRIRHLRVVPENGEEKRNPLMVLDFCRDYQKSTVATIEPTEI
jgi:hypothetical protein